MMKQKQEKSSEQIIRSFYRIIRDKYILSVLLSFFILSQMQAQDIATAPVKIGSVDEFYNTVHLSESQIKTRKIKRSTIPVIKDSVSALINLKKIIDGEEFIYGEVQNKEASSVSFSIAGGELSGHVVIPSDKKAFRYFSQQGNVFVEEEDINKVLCIDFDKVVNAEKRALPAQAPPSGSAVYNLQSLAGATAVAYLDFDGQVVSGTRWNGGNTINALPGNFSETEVTNIWKMISEDFRAFNINITTNEAVFNAAPRARRIRCIFTPTNTASPGAGGVAYVNSFRWTDDTPCWVFNSGTKGAGEAGSHEIGHTLGLSHDGRTSPREDYYSGHGIWAPIMGVGYSKGLVQWSRGEYANANQTQDDVSIIAGTGNGFGFRTDEAGNTNATAKALIVSQSGTVSNTQNYGVISQRTDVDIYSFTTSGGSVTLTINPAPSYPNLDIVATIKNAAGTTLATSNPTASAPSGQTGPSSINGLNASFNINLSAGTYYLNIDGTGQGDPATTGYSDYSSIGEYSISGTIPLAQPNQNPVVRITAPLNNAVFTAPATINVIATATDADGTISGVTFSGAGSSVTDNTSPYGTTWNNVAAGTYKIVANVRDNNGGVGTDTVTVTVLPTVNQKPVVKITSPLNNAVFTAPATINVTATASDADGTISEVTFSGIGSSVTDNTSPYGATWNNVAAGTYQIYAAVRDNNGGLNSDTITITVLPNQKPVVEITAPLNNAVFTAPATINVTATASDADGTIRGVTFIGAGTSVTDNTSPYTTTLNNVAAGTYQIVAMVYDNNGGFGGDTVTVTVLPAVNQKPVVKITSPLNNAVFTAPATINVTATASDADGTISEVVFSGIGSSVTDNTSPYGATWNNVAAGTYQIYAAVRDNNGGLSSDTITITVLPNQKPVVEITAPLNNAVFTAPATINVTATASDADGTISGVTFIGAGTSVTDNTSPYTTTLNNVAAGTYEIVAMVRDNNGGFAGDTVTITVVPAVNQNPVVKITSPLNNAVFTAPATINVTATASDADGTISGVTFSGAGTSATDNTSPYTTTWNNVAAGTYKIVANAIDNNGGVGTDTITVTVVPAVNQKPVVTIASPLNNASFNAPANITITANASDGDGTISSVAFYNGSTLLGTDNTAPYTFTISGATAGTYALTAVATDNNGGSTTSSVVTVKVENTLSTGINGPSCLIAGQKYLFVLSPEAPATNISWWTNAQATIEVDPLDKSKVYITYASNISSVNISAGANFSVSPWYKQYDKILKVGGCPSAATEEANFGKSDERQANANEEILLSLKLYDFQGKEIAYKGELTLDANKLSEYLEEGVYIVYGVTDHNVIKKKIAVKK